MVGRAVARHAGQAAAAATTATMASRAPASGRSSAQPGGCSLSASSSLPAAPRTAIAPPARPTTPATAPVRVARQACSRAMRAREKPIARCTPMAGSRRWTSAAVVAASIVAAAPSAMSENAISSAMTIPAAESISTRTPLRVTKRTPWIWVLVARACCRSTSTRPGFAAQMSAWSTGKRRWVSRSSHAREMYIRGADASGKATLSGATAIPTTRSDPSRPTWTWSPTPTCQALATPRSITTSFGRPETSRPSTIA